MSATKNPDVAGILAERLGIRDLRRGFVSLTPGDSWEMGLVSGNGCLGALVLGQPRDETIILSRAGLFMPVDAPRAPVDTASHLAEIRAMLARGEYQGAADFVVELGAREGYPGWVWTDPLIAAFDLKLTIAGTGELRDYARGVDFSTGVAAVAYVDDQGPVLRQLFVSRPANVVVLSIKRESGKRQSGNRQSGLLDCDLHLAQRSIDDLNPEDRAKAERAIRDGIESVEIGAGPSGLTYRSGFRRRWEHSLQGYEGVARVVAIGGTATFEGGVIRVRDADEVVVLVRIVLSHDFSASQVPTLERELAAIHPSFEALLDAHARVHGEVMNRVHLDLGGAEHAVPTEDLLRRADVGHVSPTLIEKEFQAARYVTYSASGDLFPTLQGIWNGSWTPPWSSDFTHNGNVPTAIAAMLSTNMAECLQPYFRYLGSQLDDYRQNARRHYDCRGIFLPSRTSSHGLDVHFGSRWCMTFWTAGAGWAAHTFYDTFLYTGDRAFLERVALPFMKEAAAFYEDFMTIGPDGKYVFSPSYSPENSPPGSDAQASVNATMDMAVARELFGNLIAAYGALGLDHHDDTNRWRAVLARLPDYQVNDDGAVKEWLHPDLADNHDHRHVSHLYALFDGLPTDIEARPELRAAFLRAAERRMEIRRRDGGGVMGFGLAQLGLCAASLRHGEICGEIIDWLASKYWRPSMVTTHDPGQLFNVDLCGGFPALIAKMLIDSRPGHLEVLPALPSAWPTGTVEGLPARGQILVERLAWDPEQIHLRLSSQVPQTLRVAFPARTGVQITVLPEEAIESLATPAGVVVSLTSSKALEIRLKSTAEPSQAA
jgi:alpha-L-fucosidase 2